MKIRELYITDVNNDGEFWSQDKIVKLNDMFIQLQAGLQPGAIGVSGSGGGPGGDGTTGGQGATGATGAIGLIGTSGKSIWTRTIQPSGLETLSLVSSNSSVILGGTSTLNNPLTCDDGTVISTTNNQKVPILGATNPSALRIHAINDTGGTQRNHIRLKSHTGSVVTTAYINLNATTETTTFDSDKINIGATNILIYDGANAVSAFTDAGIVVSSNLTFNTGTIQTFDDDVVLSNGLWTGHSTSGMWSTFQNITHTWTSMQTQIIYLNNLYLFTGPTVAWMATTATGPTNTSYTIPQTVDTLQFTYIGPADVSSKYLAGNPTETLTGKQLVVDTSLTEGNVKFDNVAGSYVSFPTGIIVQVGDETLEKYFNIHRADQSFPTNSYGYEVFYGRGKGAWDGWYVMNGQQWRKSMISDTGYPVYPLKNMNTFNHFVGLETTPTDYDVYQKWQSGGRRNFAINSSGVMQMGRDLNSVAGGIVNTQQIYPKDGSDDKFSLHKHAYVCYLNISGLVWYTDVPVTTGPSL